MECVRWWQRISSIMDLTQSLRSFGDECKDHYYQFADSSLIVNSNDEEFLERFQRIFAECACSKSSESAVTSSSIIVRRLPEEQLIAIQLTESNSINRADFLRDLFPEFGYNELPSSDDSWQLLSSKDSGGEAVLALHDEFIIADSRHPWQLTIAHYALANTMRLQPEICFFHAATVAMKKGGVMLIGDKGAGKTTLSLALADRGHAFFSDEYASIAWKTGEMLPFRRIASIRKGAQTTSVEQFLSTYVGEAETLADGTTRRRVPVGSIFPHSQTRQAVLSHVFFLRGFDAKPAVKLINLGVEHLRLMSPLIGTLWGQSSTQRAMAFIKMFSRVPCYFLTVGGTPEETAIFIENTVGI